MLDTVVEMEAAGMTMRELRYSGYTGLAGYLNH